MDNIEDNCNVKKKHHDTNCALYKLHVLVSDGVTNDSDSWISRLLYDFLQDVGDDGYKIQDLPIVMKILEFLAWRARDKEEYKIYLEKMLELCKLPPLLEKTGKNLEYRIILEQYFTMFGYLMTVVLQNDTDASNLFQVIQCLLVNSMKEANNIYLLAMERSRLPIVVAQLVEITWGVVYKRVLELVFLLVANSYTCCCKMLEVGILDNLLIRMDLRDTFNDKTMFQAETVLSIECTIVTINIAWALVRSILSPKQFAPDFQNPPEPNAKATRSLRNVLTRQIRESIVGGRKNIMLRNDLAILILAGLVAFPSWNLVKSGLAEDVILLAIGNGIEAKNSNNEDDIFFKKIMLSILCRLCNQSGGALIAIMMEQRVMIGILELINPANAESRCLSEFAIRILAILVPKMPQQYILHKGVFRIVDVLAQWSNLRVKFDSRIVMELTKCICKIVTVKCCPVIMERFREAGIVRLLVELVDRMLTFDRLTMQHQRIITLLIVIIEEIAKIKEIKNTDEKSHENTIVKILRKLLDRSFNRKKNDFQMDQRLAIAIGSCIWKCVVGDPKNTEEFVINGGIYRVLDVIENCIFPVRCIYLGILTDLCSTDGYRVVVSQLCTWRGVDKRRAFSCAILAKSWIEEEIRTGVKRTDQGIIEDTELPIMGREQRISAYHARATFDSSPAVASFVGSIRPKIYALRKIIKRHRNFYEITKERYKILLNYREPEERVTMYTADQFYRLSQGEVWSEVSRYLQQRGVNLLGIDGEIMILMNERHFAWATYLRGLQRSTILTDERKKQIDAEQNEITKIRNSKLGSSLMALKEIDYLRRTSQRNYTIQMKACSDKRCI